MSSHHRNNNFAQNLQPSGLQNDDLNRLQSDVDGFSRLAEILKSHVGIDLPVTPKNLSLMASRMRKVLNGYGFSTYNEFSKLLGRGDSKAMTEFVQALTTNTTHFFREAEHFDHLKSILPSLIAERKRAGQRELRVWCAASSTGQEPYTILMTLLESGLIPQGWEIKFLATDIDLQVLEKAANAVYREDDVENIAPMVLEKYFESRFDRDRKKWYRIRPEFSQIIRFAQLNLIEASWPLQKKFDIVFCRNVLIYFDPPTAQTVVSRLADQVTPGGYLYLGHSECGHVRAKTLKTVTAAAYQKLGSKG